MLDLKGKTVMVTGAAGNLGRATAAAFISASNVAVEFVLCFLHFHEIGPPFRNTTRPLVLFWVSTQPPRSESTLAMSLSRRSYPPANNTSSDP